MNIDPRLFVEIVPLESASAPAPHPIRQARFDANLIYKVLGMYNASETSECYFVLANPAREIWFIPQRHLRAYRLIDSDEFFLAKDEIFLPKEDERGKENAGGKDDSRSVVARNHRNGFAAHPGANAGKHNGKTDVIGLPSPMTIKEAINES